MDLPKSGVYCVAKATENQHITEATAYLPYPIDLSKRAAEIAIKYIAVTPTWNHLNDLQIDLVGHDAEDGDAITVYIRDLIDTDQESVILSVRQQLEVEFKKHKAPLLKILKSKNQKTYEFHLRKNASVKFSPELSTLFGVNQIYHSSDVTNLVFPIAYRTEEKTSTTDIYYLKTEEITSNFMIDSKLERIIELLHLPGTETLDFHPSLVYSRLEVLLLEKLTFTLYNEKNQAVKSDRSDLYIVCHIRAQP